MKRINEYKKLFNIEGPIDLKQLKTTYRNLVKEWHPDKFQAGDPKAEEAEEKSQQIIDGYHFLISIAPETKDANLAEYNKTIESGIQDFWHKGLRLDISFLDGTTYEYFGVNKNVYSKLVNADKPSRFAKRNIFNNFLYRKSKKAMETA
ncbi:DnaJ domain-containing protein [Marivirga sericea]|uniref:DnaJ domain-containing protein n=1 Tax=Marivirga sericea TaxID=1028 RepID=A0A1X7ID18_9BACT|nr:KTSC domain-containing protein [Marivirga sericea]SMG12579.1 DnaJ domain-containing protein [Marivirga sericea]